MNVDFLLNSLAAQPQTQPIDAVKWLYQSEFGCGHMLPPEADCAARIAQEISQTAQTAAEPAFTPLGDGLCRLHLAHPLTRALPPVRIARMMLATDVDVRGTQAGFERKLAILASLADAPPARQRLPFSAQALAETLHALRVAPPSPPSPPSHSPAYRRAYSPAYRVVLRRYGEALPLLAALETALARDGRAVLVLDGDCASGKTTLTALLAQLYDCNVIHMDDFFLPFALRTPARMAEAGGNVHYERFAAQVLAGLQHGGIFAYEAYNCHTGECRTVQLAPAPVTLIEGSYALHPRFATAYTALHAVRALMQVDTAEQERRIRARNGQTMLARFQNEWIPLEKRYFQAYHSAQAGMLVLHSERHTEDERSGEAETL